MLRILKCIASALAGAFCFFFGPWNAVMSILLAIVIIDYVTGVISAAMRGMLSSKKGFGGILKKIFIFMIVALAAMADRLFPMTNQAIRTTVCMFYIANESLSVLENAGEIGLKLPKALKDAIEKLKD